MDRIEDKSIGLLSPDFADVLVRREAVGRLETTGVIVGIEKIREVSKQLFVAVVVVPFDGGVLDCAIHALDLTVGPRVVRFG